MTNAEKTQLIADLINKTGIGKSNIRRRAAIAEHSFQQKVNLRPTYERGFNDNELMDITNVLNEIGCEILALVNKLEQE